MAFDMNDTMYGGMPDDPMQPQQQKPRWQGFLQNTMQGMAQPQQAQGQASVMNPGGNPQANPLPKRGILGAMNNMGGDAAKAAAFFL